MVLRTYQKSATIRPNMNASILGYLSSLWRNCVSMTWLISSKSQCLCTFMSSDPAWSILGNGIDGFWGYLWNGNQWINERDSSVHEFLLKTSSHSLASRQNEGTQHNSWFIPLSLALIKSRSKTSSESLCDIRWLVILPCAPATLPVPGSGLRVFWGQLPSCSCRAGRKSKGKKCTVQPC